MGKVDEAWRGAMQDKAVLFRQANLVKNFTTYQATSEMRRMNDVAKNVLRRR